MDKQNAVGDFSIFDLQLNRLIALCANGFDGRVAMKRGGDAEHVPGTVGEVGFSVRADFEVCWDGRERPSHADGVGLWLEEDGVMIR